MNEKHSVGFMKLAERITNEGSVRGKRFALELSYKTPRTLLKHLNEYGVLGVATVREIGWAGHEDRDYFLVWITELGQEYLTGKTPIIEKECTLEEFTFGWWTGVCKRHNRRHTREEHDESVRNRKK